MTVEQVHHVEHLHLYHGYGVQDLVETNFPRHVPIFTLEKCNHISEIDVCIKTHDGMFIMDNVCVCATLNPHATQLCYNHHHHLFLLINVGSE